MILLDLGAGEAAPSCTLFRMTRGRCPFVFTELPHPNYFHVPFMMQFLPLSVDTWECQNFNFFFFGMALGIRR